MDRQTVYPGAIPLETDILNTNRNALIGLAKLSGAIFGTNNVVNGLACTPTAPASLQVQVSPGEIYSLQNIDSTAYSSLAADTVHQIVKQGLMMDAVTLNCPAPTTNGYSINYLVEATYQEVDGNAVVLPYYNASNPSQAYSGPSNNGTAQNTSRKGVCAVQVKAGIAASTGSQQTPAADSGYVALWAVTVTYGQTQIIASNITQVADTQSVPVGGMLQRLQRGIQRFTSNGSFTVPAGVTTIYLSGCAAGGGAGGAGGAVNAFGAGGGGGGGGAGESVIKRAFQVTPGQIITITIGGGGAGGIRGTPAVNAGNGASGGNTVIGNLLTLSGGGAGGGGRSFTNSGTPAGGGAGDGYPAGSSGNDGASGTYLGVGSGGVGGSSPFGGGGGAGRAGGGGGISGGAPFGFGGGGGGAGGGGGSSSAGADGGGGAAGAPGLVLIEW